MKRKISPAIILILTASMVIACYTSCNKASNCDDIYTGQNPFIYLQINNSMNQNLLNPATTGHYDTALIKTLNGNKISLTRPGILPVMFVINYTTADLNSIISLSNTDQDTLTIATTVNAQRCSIANQLNTFKYNGITLTSNTNLYTTYK